jgi:hypothetical protein
MRTNQQVKDLKVIHRFLVDCGRKLASMGKSATEKSLKDLCDQLCLLMERLAAEVVTEIRKEGGREHFSTGTIGGAVHRVLLNVWNWVNSTLDVNLLAENERFVAEVRGRYAYVLDKPELDPEVREMLVRQEEEVRRGLAQLTMAREIMESGVPLSAVPNV